MLKVPDGPEGQPWLEMVVASVAASSAEASVAAAFLLLAAVTEHFLDCRSSGKKIKKVW